MGQVRIRYQDGTRAVNGVYHCPICGVAGEPSPRYPRYICVNCAKRATSESGRPLKFFNESMSGGFVSLYADNNEPYNGHVCYVDGRKCFAGEAHMGGIVVSIYDEPKEAD